MDLSLVEKLQRIYNTNVNVPDENFDMSVWKEEQECGTSACMIGNAILHDQYFVNNGLDFEEFYILFQEYENIEALMKFFGISKVFTKLLFLVKASKIEVLALWSCVIEFLKNNPDGKMWELLEHIDDKRKEYDLENVIEYCICSFSFHSNYKLTIVNFSDLILMFKDNENSRNINNLYRDY